MGPKSTVLACGPWHILSSATCFASVNVSKSSRSNRSHGKWRYIEAAAVLGQ